MSEDSRYGCSMCRDEGMEFYPKSVKEQMDHAKKVHGSTRFDDPSWKTDSTLKLLGEIMGLPND